MVETLKDAAKRITATDIRLDLYTCEGYTLARLGIILSEGAGHRNGTMRISAQKEELVSKKLGDVAAAVGKGLFAGVAGTAAMTASSTLEMKLRDRGASSTPAQAAAKVLGVEPVDEASEARFSNIVHWGYGISWGGVRGLLTAAGLSGSAATAAHLAAVWGTEQVMLPALDVTPPLTEWGKEEITIDALHHLVYAVATGIAYSRLDRT